MTKVKILNISREAELLYSIQILAPQEIYKKYQIPGQYGIFSLDQEQKNKIYLAFSSAPLQKEPIIELLVKEKGEVAQNLIQLKPNDEFYLIDIQGNGFPLEKLIQKDIEAFSMGSGIAPIRALIQSILNGMVAIKSLKIWISAFSEQYLPYKNDFKFWESIFPIKYIYDKVAPFKNVIDHLKEDFSLSYENKTVIWIGSEEYGKNLWDILQNRGLKKENFLTNYEII